MSDNNHPRFEAQRPPAPQFEGALETPRFEAQTGTVETTGGFGFVFGRGFGR